MKHVLRLVLLAAVLSIAVSLSAQLRIVEIPFDAADPLKGLPDDLYIGEVAGVATNSRGHLFVYTRTGSPQLTLGTERHFHRGNGAARLFEFDPTGTYVRELGRGLYGFVFAHCSGRSAGQHLDGRRGVRHDCEIQPSGADSDGARPHARISADAELRAR